MKYLQALWGALFDWFHPHAYDKYVPIEVAPKEFSSGRITPHLEEVARQLFEPSEVDRMLQIAIKAHADPVNQEKWLRAIPVLRESKRSWVLDTFIPKLPKPV